VSDERTAALGGSLSRAAIVAALESDSNEDGFPRFYPPAPSEGPGATPAEPMQVGPFRLVIREFVRQSRLARRSAPSPPRRPSYDFNDERRIGGSAGRPVVVHDRDGGALIIYIARR